MARKKKVKPVDERQFRSSSHREKVVEHVFLGELLRYLWVAKISGVQVLKPEVDAAGYDLVLSLGKVIRHVQLKTSMHDAKARSQPIHESLGEHPSGCIVWIRLNDDLTLRSLSLVRRRSRGNRCRTSRGSNGAKHARANAEGVKKEREQTRRIPHSKFKSVPDLAELVGKLFWQVPVA